MAIPFSLLDQRLISLEKKLLGFVEGEKTEECMRILRHECGHAIENAYRLRRLKSRQQTFGTTSTPYPTRYRPDPRSRHYVRNLEHYYAQAHPDEDFAETFAVWLDPKSDWQRKYRLWPALKKLQYIDELMASVAQISPSVRERTKIDPLSELRSTLHQHYARKQSKLGATRGLSRTRSGRLVVTM